MLGETLPANWVKTPTGTLNLATLHFRTGWLKGWFRGRGNFLRQQHTC